ncbi:MAG TPA: TonB-dependent receptor [Burkholderiales bacterium]|nr:TonB-dependent receptor [Burkholderiales bacterium]
MSARMARVAAACVGCFVPLQAGAQQDSQTIEVIGHYETGLGTTDAASAGVITRQAIDDRPLLRPGEVLELVPGMIVTQHSGAGKANQYFLRGFNLDHGTDFATSIDGMPVNERTHAHGQGYTDLNFLIPELVTRVAYEKGPYFAGAGDFATAGSAEFHYSRPPRPGLAEVSIGSGRYGRALLSQSGEAGTGRWLYALEAFHDDGPWQVAQNYRKYNAVARYTLDVGEASLGVTAMGYHGQWYGTEPIPRRAVDAGIVDRFGSLDSSDGAETHRYSLSVDYASNAMAGRLESTAYAIRYALDLYSNFTFFLQDPVHGDQIEQSDSRLTSGWNGRWTGATTLAGVSMTNMLGWDLRNDRIDPVALRHTEQRQRLETVREDRVDETSGAVYAQNESQWTDWLRSIVGIRAERFAFRVASDVAANSGSRGAGIGLPKASLVVGPWRETELFLNAGEGFHSNDARGVLSTVDPATGAQVASATPLVRAKGVEIGAKTEAVPGLQSSIVLWQLKLGSELVFSGDEGTTEPSRPSKRVGIELSNHYAPRRWLLMDLDVAWTRARFTDDDPSGNYVPDSLEWTAQGGITVRELGPWTFAISGRYFGPRALTADGSIRSSSTTLFNLQASWNLSRNALLRLDIFNLFDRRADDITYYYSSRLPGEPAAGIADFHFHPMEPRAVRVAWLWHF